MKFHLCMATLVMLLFVATGTLVWCQSDSRGSESGKFSTTAERTAKDRQQAILSEIASLKEHDWAGEYFEGDGLGVNILLAAAPKSGYVLHWHGCLGVYDRNYGNANFGEDRIQLAFTYDNKREGFQGIASEFMLVRWGKRRYLIPDDQMISFCNSVNKGDEPRRRQHGMHLLRRGDEKLAVEGLPEVPTESRPYLLKSPVEARLVSPEKLVFESVDKVMLRTTKTVKFNVGSDQGLRPGMRLHLIKPRIVPCWGEISAVEANRSEAVLEAIGDVEEWGPPAEWVFSTRDQ